MTIAETSPSADLSLFDNRAAFSITSLSSDDSSPRNPISGLTSYRRRSSEKKFQRVLHALSPFRRKGRSRSVSTLEKKPPRQPATIRLPTSDNCEMTGQSRACYLQATNASLTVPIVKPTSLYQYRDTNTSSEDDLTALPPLLASHVHRLDHDLIEPDANLREFRRKWPKTFTNLVANYLSFLEFQADDLFRIADEIGKNEMKRNGRTCMGSPITRSVFTPIRFSSRLANWGSSKAQREEMAHWYTVTHAMINYLLENERYCTKFIFRRPGVQTQVNELEKLVMSQKNLSSRDSLNGDGSSSFSTGSSNESVESASIGDILERYDVLTVASTLTRILRRHGSLIPQRLHYLFTQLADDPDDGLPHTGSMLCAQANRRRGLRLLLQLTPSRHLSLVYKPLCHLLVKICAEPKCELDMSSLAVLFAPVLLLDRDNSMPASLANPKLAQIVRLLLELTKRELGSMLVNPHNLFKVPRLFLYDCHRNLKAHMECEDPPMYCSLRYCATITNRQPIATQTPCHGLKRSASTDTISSLMQIAPLTRDESVPLHATQNSHSFSPPLKIPAQESDDLPMTPIIRRPLHSSQLNFKVRRTPHISRQKATVLTPITPLRMVS